MTAKEIYNIGYLGRCFDIVSTDPLNLGSTAKTRNAIDVDTSKGGDTSQDGKWVIPYGSTHSSPMTTSFITSSVVISSKFDFKTESELFVEANAGVDGAFEFSGSASAVEINNLTESRQSSFVFSRAFREIHKIDLDLSGAQTPLRTTGPFASAVAALPDTELGWVTAYNNFIKEYGTHFSKGVTLGGLAFQRASGSSKTYLRSKQTELTLKAQGSLEIEQIKAGIGGQQAHKDALANDQQYHLTRNILQFRGGAGNPTEIDKAWIDSCEDTPACVRVCLEPLATLLTPHLFPKEKSIQQKQIFLKEAVYAWIDEHGLRGDVTQPLQYGEPLTVMLHGSISNRLGYFVVSPVDHNKHIFFPSKEPSTPDPAAFNLESIDPSNDNVVMAGDRLRLKFLDKGTFINVEGVNDFFVLRAGDDPFAPTRIGEYLLEGDAIRIFTGVPGKPEAVLRSSLQVDWLQPVPISHEQWPSVPPSSFLFELNRLSSSSDD